MKYYLEIKNDNFGFLVDEVHDIPADAIAITTEEYITYFELVGMGKQFRVKKGAHGTRLFDFIEEYIPVFTDIKNPPSAEERLSALEELMMGVI